MTATLGGWLLILLLLAYLLHILWRQIAARSPVAIASFIAAYFVLAAFFRLSEPYTPLRPVWLPFVYSYSWLAIAAALWLPASACSTTKLARTCDAGKAGERAASARISATSEAARSGSRCRCAIMARPYFAASICTRVPCIACSEKNTAASRQP